MLKLLIALVLTQPPPIPQEGATRPPPIPQAAPTPRGATQPRTDAGLSSLPPIDFDLSALRAPEVAAPVAPFRGIERRDSHACPQCGRLVYAKSGRGPAPGTHRHRCAWCNVEWYHADK